MLARLFQAILSWIAISSLISPLATAIPVYGDNTTTPNPGSDTSINPFHVGRYNFPPVNPPELRCGFFSTADWRDIALHVEAMKRDDPFDCGVPARTCRRVACRQTSGVYVCNDMFHDLLLSCKNDVAPHAERIFKQCCRVDGTNKAVSGQSFVDSPCDRKYNVVVAYANCNHDRDADRPGKPNWGPNGECR